MKKLFCFGKKTRIPTQRKDHVAEKVIKLFTEWANLKKNKENKKKRSSQLIKNENDFNKRLDNLFDVAHKNAMELIRIEENHQFLLYQKEGRQGRTIDKNHFKKKLKEMKKS